MKSCNNCGLVSAASRLACDQCGGIDFTSESVTTDAADSTFSKEFMSKADAMFTRMSRVSIASAAMSALIDRGSTWAPNEVACQAVAYADALLKALDEPQS